MVVNMVVNLLYIQSTPYIPHCCLVILIQDQIQPTHQIYAVVWSLSGSWGPNASPQAADVFKQTPVEAQNVSIGDKLIS